MKQLVLSLALALGTVCALAPASWAQDLDHNNLDHAEMAGMSEAMVDPSEVDPGLLLPGPIEKYASERAAKGSDRYIRKGDLHMKSAHYQAATEAYKIALEFDPTNEKIWKKHRQAFQMDRAIEGYIAKAEALLDKGLHEEAASFLKLAVRLSPRNQILWRLYERALSENPHVVVVTTEQEAWDSYRRGREVLDGGRYDAAIRYFEPVIAFTKDERLRFYASRLLSEAEEKVRENYPNLPKRIVDR
jgi:tetratricopeptide (TPR) repeat protein